MTHEATLLIAGILLGHWVPKASDAAWAAASKRYRRWRNKGRGIPMAIG